MKQIVKKEIELKIYFKKKRRPIATVILDNEKQVEAFYSELRSQKIVVFGALIFATDEFKFAIVTERNKR